MFPHYQRIVRVSFTASSVVTLTLLKIVPPYTPTSTPLVPTDGRQEIVLFSGMPSLGKTSFYRKHFEPADYVHVNQDTLKSRDKCIKRVEQILKEGRSCVVGQLFSYSPGPSLTILNMHQDNTNRDQVTRKYYVDLSQRHKVSVR